MLRKPAGAIALIALFVVTLFVGQTLISEGQTAEAMQSIPTRGMTMEVVESNFGRPSDRRAPVGDPPITRWEYPEFIVYFEYKRVIHSVPKRPTYN